MPLIEPVMLDFFMFTKSIPLLSYLLGEFFQLLHLIKEAKYKFLQAEEYLEWIASLVMALFVSNIFLARHFGMNHTL